MADDSLSNLQLPQEITVPSSEENASVDKFDSSWSKFCDLYLINIETDSFPGVELDSCNIGNEPDQQQLVPNEYLQGLQSQNNVVLSSTQLPTQIPTVGSNVQNSSLPACENWPGQYNFNVSFSPQHKSTKGVAWTYSQIRDKLYVGKDVPCPINFSTSTQLPSDAYIRVMALYTSPEQVTDAVRRCVNHSMKEIQDGRVEAEHLIRCECTAATYHIIAGRHSVLVPFENPPAGQQYSTYIYKFACFGSCAGGPNRRPLMLIFTLEMDNEVVGRRKLDVKICACPGRDRKSDEAQCTTTEVSNLPAVTPGKRKITSESVSLSEIMDFTKTVTVPLPKKSKVSPNKDGVYVMHVEDKECYDFLKQMKKLYEICKTMKNLPPDVIDLALQHMQRVKDEKRD